MDRLNKLCDIADFPVLARHMAAVHDPHVPGKEQRKQWEVAMALATFEAMSPPGPLRALGVGAGRERTTFWLTRCCEQVHATDLYATSTEWSHTAPRLMLIAPAAAFRDFSWNPRRLIVQHMDGRDLRYEDETFDFVYSSSSIEHFGETRDVLTAMREIGRVLKPGGVASLSTEYKIAGEGRGFHNVLLFDEDDLRAMVEASGLQLAGRLDLTPGSSPVVSFARAIEDIEKTGAIAEFPHINLEFDGMVWTSVHLALKKCRGAAG